MIIMSSDWQGTTEMRLFNNTQHKNIFSIYMITECMRELRKNFKKPHSLHKGV